MERREECTHRVIEASMLKTKWIFGERESVCVCVCVWGGGGGGGGGLRTRQTLWANASLLAWYKSLQRLHLVYLTNVREKSVQNERGLQIVKGKQKL